MKMYAIGIVLVRIYFNMENAILDENMWFQFRHVELGCIE